MSTLPLIDRTIVIIGGTSGLGLSAAMACIEAGAKVVTVGRNPHTAAQAQRSLGDRAQVLEGDAADPRTATRAIQAAVDDFGRFDGLYHVAGGSGRSHGDGPLDRCTDEGWQKTLDANLTGLFYSNRAAARQFLSQGTGGSVLNMTSVLAFAPSPEHFATHAYAAAKSAVIGLTRAAAAYYAPHGIRFNAVAPGLIETPMSQRAAGDEQIMSYVATKQPLDGGRIGQPDDLDAAVVYLLSDQSRFVTGQVLTVDGGWSIREGSIPGPP